MHVRSKFTPCKNKVLRAIFAVISSFLLQIPTDLKSCGEYAFVKACSKWSSQYSHYLTIAQARKPDRKKCTHGVLEQVK